MKMRLGSYLRGQRDRLLEERLTSWRLKVRMDPRQFLRRRDTSCDWLHQNCPLAVAEMVAAAAVLVPVASAAG